jgi:hypothetical protein
LEINSTFSRPAYQALSNGTSVFIGEKDRHYTYVFSNEDLASNSGVSIASQVMLKPTCAFATSFANYQFSNISADLYFTKTLLTNLNSSKQVR